MKYFLLLQAVLLWTITTAHTDTDADTDDGLEFHKMNEGTDFEGNDVENCKAGDEMYCQLLCSFHSHCTHFSYVEDSFDCYMKHVEHGTPVESTPKDGVVSGHAIPAHLMDDFQCYDHLFEELDFPGNDILVLSREAGDDCKEACTSYEDCEYFTFNTQKKLCYLKSVTTLPSPPEINIVHGVISGYTLKDCEADLLCNKECTDLVLDGYEFPGFEFHRMIQPDPDRCQMVCNDLPRCKFFTFINESCPEKELRFMCSLKSFDADVPSEMIPMDYRHSGYSLRTVRSHKSCSLEVYDDLDFPGNDQTQMKVDSHQDCRRECTYNPLCQFWTWVDTDFPQEDLHNNCYLKNVLALPTPPVIKIHEHAMSGFSQKRCMDDEHNYESLEASSEDSKESK